MKKQTIFFLDIDECQIPQLAAKCVDNAECCNLPAEYICKCKPGFEGDGQVECLGEWLGLFVYLFSYLSIDISFYLSIYLYLYLIYRPRHFSSNFSFLLSIQLEMSMIFSLRR